MKKILSIVLSVCFLMACMIPAYTAFASSVDDYGASNLNGSYSAHNDPENKDFFRLILPSDFKRFGNKMKGLYTDFDLTARTLKTSWDLAYFDSACSAKKIEGPIGVVPVKLNGREATLVILGGTQFVSGQATGAKEDCLSALEKPNDYLENIIKVFNSKDSNSKPVIPPDKPVIVSGISLGGMVAQQLLENKDIMTRFDIEYIICFGSPLISPDYRTAGTTVVRFCDTMDIIPYCGKSKFADIVLGSFCLGNLPLNKTISEELNAYNPSEKIIELDRQEKILKNGGYKSPISAHTLSYVDGDCWKGYDVLGVYGGSNQIEMETEIQFFAVPSIKR